MDRYEAVIMKIESRTGKSAHPSKQLYEYISDFRNFEQFLPQEQVSEWQAEADHCSFRVLSIGRIEIRIVEKKPFDLIKVESEPSGSSQNFTLWIQFKELAADDTRIRITVEPKVNQFILAMIKPQLKKFVDRLVDRMETLAPRSDTGLK